MKINWKQLFCNHIYKATGEEFLSSERERWATFFATYNRYAVFFECIKCGKKKVIETKRLVI